MLKFSKAISKRTEKDVTSKSTEELKTSPIFLIEGKKLKKKKKKKKQTETGNVK